MPSSLLLIGCGNMGGAMLRRWQHVAPSGIDRFHIVDPKKPEILGTRTSWHARISDLPADTSPRVIVLAVKPQELGALLPTLRTRFSDMHPLYLSVAAGKTLAWLQQALGKNAVVRAMPNTPALIGQAATALCAASNVSEGDQALAEALMNAVGQSWWVEHEEMLEAVTALSGSGPAYVFYFLECLIKAGVSLGLPEKLAGELAVQTVGGSLSLQQETGESWEELRKKVTSPNGTTAAALEVLMQHQALELLLADALFANKKRAQELAKG